MQINELKAVMARRGVSQRRLAELTGMNRNTLAGKMSGNRPFDVDEAVIICKALDITDPVEQTFIFFGKSEPKTTQN
jgi:transcriptional regulator with XRE-family HTH domain